MVETSVMSEPTYTMSIKNEADFEEVVARGVQLKDALKIAIEHDGSGDAIVLYRDLGEARFYSIGRRLTKDGSFEGMTFVFLERSANPDLDEDHALRDFEQTLLDNTGTFWRGRVETDDEHVRRHREYQESNA